MIQESIIYGFLGGLLIGLAASIYLLLNGKIMGVSGILAGIFERKNATIELERMGFILGLIVAPLIIGFYNAPPPSNATTHIPLLIVAGLLVGFGTRMASGCTSGHGICGLARFSKRSLIATIVFMSFGILTVFLVRFLGLSNIGMSL